MQASDFLAQINGLFSGRRRKSDGLTLDGETQDSEGGPGFFADKFRRKSDAVLGNGGSKSSKQDGGSGNGKSGRISLVRVAKLDFKFQGRFLFRPLSTVPLPEPFSGGKKSYPSKIPRRHVLQRPPSQPPPPPPPVDSSPSPTSPKSFNLKLPSLHNGGGKDQPLPPPPLSLSHSRSDNHLSSNKMNGHHQVVHDTPSSLYNDVIEYSPEPPPPPARPLPPPPQSSKKPLIKLSSFTTTPAAPVIHNEPRSPETSQRHKDKPPVPFYATAPRPKSLKSSTTPTGPITDPKSLTETYPSSSSSPPLPAKPGVPSSTKPKLTNGVGSHDSESLKSPRSPGDNGPLAKFQQISNSTSSSKHRELPDLPSKPSQNGKNSSVIGISMRPLNGNTADKNFMMPMSAALPPPPLLPSPPSGLQPPLPPRPSSPLPPPPPPPPPGSSLPSPPSRCTSPLPPPPPLTETPPSPPPVNNPNRNRPLPSLPTSPTILSPPLTRRDGWGGREVFDPREEDGDLYDVMDSTNM